MTASATSGDRKAAGTRCLPSSSSWGTGTNRTFTFLSGFVAVGPGSMRGRKRCSAHERATKPNPPLRQGVRIKPQIIVIAEASDDGIHKGRIGLFIGEVGEFALQGADDSLPLLAGGRH